MPQKSHLSAALLLAVLSLSVACLPSLASAHVNLLTPSDSATLTSGSVQVITWEVAISHDTLVWHLEYSTDGSSWVGIQRDIPFATLSYDWTVPDVECSACTLRITQDNDSDADYDDTVTVTITAGGATDGGTGGADSGTGGTDSGPPGVDSGTGGVDSGPPSGTDGGSGRVDSGTGSGSDGGCETAVVGSHGCGSALAFCLACLLSTRRRRRRPLPG